MILQLNPTMPVLTPKGPALAHFLIDYGEEHHLMWVCVINETGEVWTYQNPFVRAQSNPTLERYVIKPTWVPDHGRNNQDDPYGDLDRQC